MKIAPSEPRKLVEGELRPTDRPKPVLAPVAFGAWAIETPTEVTSERY